MAAPPRKSVLWTARIVTTIVSIAGAEGLLGFMGYPSWLAQQPVAERESEYSVDPELGWINKPGKFEFSSFLRKEPFHYTNWTGGRRATAEAESATNLPQSIFVGDSYIQGFGLSDAETLPWIYQQKHPDRQVLNYGTSYYGTYQSSMALNRALTEASPGGEVFYLLNWFHEGRNVAEAGWPRVVKPPPPGFFYPYATLENGQIRGHRSEGNLVWGLSWHSKLIAMAEEYYEMAQAYSRVRQRRAVTEALLSSMDRAVRAKQGRLTVILFDFEADDRKEYVQFLQSNHIAFVNCDRPEMKDSSLRLPDGHPAMGMNKLLADWITSTENSSGLAAPVIARDAR